MVSFHIASTTIIILSPTPLPKQEILTYVRVMIGNPPSLLGLKIGHFYGEVSKLTFLKKLFCLTNSIVLMLCHKESLPSSYFFGVLHSMVFFRKLKNWLLLLLPTST